MKIFKFGHDVGDDAAVIPGPPVVVPTSYRLSPEARQQLAAFDPTDRKKLLRVIHKYRKQKPVSLGEITDAQQIADKYKLTALGSRFGTMATQLAGAVKMNGTEVGLIFDKALDNAAYTKPVPTKYVTTIYQQRQKRIGGNKFWDQQTDFTEDSADEAERKAKAYIASKGWTLIPYA